MQFYLRTAVCMLKNYQKGVSHTNTNCTGKNYYTADVVVHPEQSTIAPHFDLFLAPNKRY